MSKSGVFFPENAAPVEKYIDPASQSVIRMNMMIAHIFLHYISRKVRESAGRVDLTKFMIGKYQ